MNETVEAKGSDDFEYVFAGTGSQVLPSTTCSTSDKCDKECVGGTASTGNMNQTMVAT